MALSDVWRDPGRQINVYTGTRFERVPAVPGVYAWFYPLRLTHFELRPLIEEVQKVLFFDAATNDFAERNTELSFVWRRIKLGIKELPEPWAPFGGYLGEAWEKVTADDAAFSAFRQALMKASIFLPPLYVGTASNLYVRCWQHINGARGNTFHDRYETFAAQQNLTAPLVRDLLFACIPIDAEALEIVSGGTTAELVEGVLKVLSRPPFGLR